MKRIKKKSKNSIEKSLNTLVLIILLLSFGLVGSFVYESNITTDNKITGKAVGMDGVSGFATFHQGKSGTSTDQSSAPVNIFTPGQPFVFDPSNAKDHGNGIYEIKTSDGKSALYDTKGQYGPTVYIQSSTTPNIDQYDINNPSYLYQGLPRASADISSYGNEIKNAWLSATTPQQPTQTDQQPRTIPPGDINPPTAKENKVIDVGGKKIELKPGEAYDRVTGIIIGKQRVTTTEGPKPIYYRLRDDNVPIYVYGVDKSSGLQTIDIGGIPYRIYPELLKGVQYDKWDGMSIANIPTSSGKKEIKIDPKTGTQKATDTIFDKKGEITRTEITTISPSSKTIEQSKTAYFYEGKEITKEQADKLSDSEKSKVIKRENFPTSTVIEETEGNKKYLTRYEYETKFDSRGNPSWAYEAIKVDQKTGEVTKLIYEDEVFGKIVLEPVGVGFLDIFSPKYSINEKESNFKGEIPPELSTETLTASRDYLEGIARERLRQLASRQFFSTVESILTEFQGLGYYATLFFDEDSLLAWRDAVDRVFATAYLGTEYWTSAICGQYLDGEDVGIAYAETPQGYAQVGAHIEAVRTEPIKNENGTTVFIYKITFNVRNGDYEKDPRAPEEMKINVILKGQRTAEVFSEEVTIKRGSTFGKTGKNAIVQDSTTLFNQVCLTFDKIPFRWKLDNNELCNTIQQSSGEPTTITATTATTTSGGKTESEINDF